jgi:hypothetical protein
VRRVGRAQLEPPVSRTFRKEVVESMPWLPGRLTVDELKNFGMVNLLHTGKQKGRTPWIEAGFYKMIKHQKLYIIKIGPNTTKGQPQTTWLYKPIIRVAGAAR